MTSPEHAHRPAAPESPGGAPAPQHPGSSRRADASRLPGEDENLVVRLLKGLVDVRFRRSIAADGAGVIYVLWVIAVVLHWLGWIIIAAMIGFSSSSSYWDDSPRAPWLPVLVVLLGWIPALLAIIAGRIAIELVTSTVRTARDTRASAELLARIAERTGAVDPATATTLVASDPAVPARADGGPHA